MELQSEHARTGASKMEPTKQDIDAVEDALGAPAGCELPDNVLKIRRNLLVVSMASIAMILAGVHINPSSTLFGLQFSGLNDEIIAKGLIAVLSYLFIHFLWCLNDAFLTWKIRVTGTRLVFVTTGKFANEYADYPNDPRSSSLYWWWLEEAKKIGGIGSKIDEIERALNSWEQKIQALMLNKAKH